MKIKFLKMIQLQYGATEWLTTHLSLEELNEGLCEGLDPLVHDVVTLFRCVFIVEELDVVLLRKFYKHERMSSHIHIFLKAVYSLWLVSQKSQKQQIYVQLLWPQCDINKAFYYMCSIHNHVSKGDAVAQWSVSCEAEGSSPGCQKGIRCKTISKSLIWVC